MYVNILPKKEVRHYAYSLRVGVILCLQVSVRVLSLLRVGLRSLSLSPMPRLMI